MSSEFPQLSAELDSDYPDEWLLRWNMLESLMKVGDEEELSRRLRARLEHLEEAFDHRQPIASGLRYLSSR